MLRRGFFTTLLAPLVAPVIAKIELLKPSPTPTTPDRMIIGTGPVVGQLDISIDGEVRTVITIHRDRDGVMYASDRRVQIKPLLVGTCISVDPGTRFTLYSTEVPVIPEYRRLDSVWMKWSAAPEPHATVSWL